MNINKNGYRGTNPTGTETDTKNGCVGTETTATVAVTSIISHSGVLTRHPKSKKSGTRITGSKIIAASTDRTTRWGSHPIRTNSSITCSEIKRGMGATE